MIDDDSFIELIEKHRDEFYRFVHHTLWNQSNADDVFSEAILVAYSKRSSFAVGTNFRAWMFKILLNKCYVANRETGRSPVSVDSVEEWISAENDTGYKEMIDDPDWFVDQVEDEVLSAMDKLRTVEKACLLLLTFEKYSYKEISSLLDIPVGTVITHLSRGRTRLRKTLLSYARTKGVIAEEATTNRPHAESKKTAQTRRSS
jgi:RNA polymerase sigma-70 factor, ECF subfamily